MPVAGLYARRSDKRFDVAVAVLVEDRVIEHTHLSASAGESESGQLRELNVRAHEVLRPHDQGVLVVWSPDPPPGGRVRLLTTLATGRAEGAVLVAAGDLGWQSTSISGAGIRSAGGKKTDEAVENLCSALADVPIDPSVQRAIAAAQAWRLKHP